jgi:hypothetical protein
MRSRRLLALTAAAAAALVLVLGLRLLTAQEEARQMPWSQIGAGAEGRESGSTNYGLRPAPARPGPIGLLQGPARRIGAGYLYGIHCPNDNDGLTRNQERALGTKRCVNDTDRDGCADGEEAAPKSAAQQGGGRSPLSFWDFYDVWEEMSPNVWQRNKTVNVLGDIIGVAGRFGALHSMPYPKAQALADALTPPTSVTGYHASFDRGTQNGPNPWNANPPNGAINVFDDILGVASQFGHNCTAAP